MTARGVSEFMATGDRGASPKALQALFSVGTAGDHTDGRLLELFAFHRDESAFEVLVIRHGPMVLRICRATLTDSHDVDDAFQAVFLVLARRASSIRSRESVASWLFSVATRVAARARVDAARRRKHERLAGELKPSIGVLPIPDEPTSLLLDELNRLPGSYRDALILCYLEGLSCEAAAKRLQRPVGTIKSHLARGRKLLQQRLVRRGIAFPASLIAAGISTEVSAAISSELLRMTVVCGLRCVSGVALPSSSAISLAEGVLKSMLLNKVGSILLLATGLASGTILIAHGQSLESPRPQPETTRVTAAPPHDAAKAALAEAFAGDLAADPYEMTFALIALARAQNNAGDHESALTTFRQADQVAEKVANEHLRRLALMRTAVARGKIGDVEPAKVTLERFAKEAAGLSGKARYELMSMVIDFQFDAGFKEAAKANFKTELGIITASADARFRLGGISRLLNNQLHFGDFDGALHLIESDAIQKPEERNSLVHSLMNDHLYPPGMLLPIKVIRRAIEIARECPHPYPRAMSESAIAIILAKAGDIEGGLTLARGIEEEANSPFEIRSDQVPDALVGIAKIQAKVGPFEAAKATLKEALTIAQTRKDKDLIYSSRIRTIIEAQAELGEGEAIKDSARMIESDAVETSTALVAIARSQTKSGYKTLAKGTLKEAHTVAKSIQVRTNLVGDNAEANRNRIFREIAVAWAEAGDLDDALAIVDSHGDDDWKMETLAAIAPIRAQSGDIAGALLAAKSATKSASAYAAIARSQAKAGDADGALIWASRLASPARLFAIIGINEGIALRQKETQSKETKTPQK